MVKIIAPVGLIKGFECSLGVFDHLLDGLTPLCPALPEETS
jgi:hypothetical protein